MDDKFVNEMIIELSNLYEESHGPFPYSDCRKLIGKEVKRYEDLTADLNMYFSTIAGYCSWGKRILKWSNDQVKEAEARLEKTFFEKYPQYGALKHLITEANTPDLYKEMTVYESMRALLLSVFSQLQTN
jgi:hypothetical protein